MVGALSLALYSVSVLVVTALTPRAGHVAQAAQLAVSTVWGVGLLGAGVVRRSPLGLFLLAGAYAYARLTKRIEANPV